MKITLGNADDEPIDIQFESDGEKHGDIAVCSDMAEIANLHEYVLVPTFDYDEDLDELFIDSYNVTHVSNIGSYLKKLASLPTTS